MNWTIPRLSVSAALLALLPSCSNSAEVGYRVTAVVTDGGKRYQGSAIWTVRVSKPIIALDAIYGGSFHGEAVPVVLPGQGILLFLPKTYGVGWDDFAMIPENMFGDHGLNRVESARDVSKMVGSVKPIRCTFRPPDKTSGIADSARNEFCPIVAFISNPSSIGSFRVCSQGRLDCVPMKDVYITRVYVTITNDKPTSTIEALLPWLRSTPTIARSTGVQLGAGANPFPDEILFLRR